MDQRSVRDILAGKNLLYPHLWLPDESARLRACERSA